MGSPFKFTPMGHSGIEVSELFPNVGTHIDDLAIIRSMHTDIPAHEVATVFMNTGSLRIIKPSLGSWVVYGLGTENQNLPGFIALRNGGLPSGGSTNYGAGFLPGVFQGTSINMQAASVQQMIQNIRNPYVGPARAAPADRPGAAAGRDPGAQPAEGRAAGRAAESYEIAFRMQAEATDAFDLNKETPEVHAAYGAPRRAGSCSSRAALSSAVCDSCRCGTTAGTITRTCRNGSPRRRAKSTSRSRP